MAKDEVLPCSQGQGKGEERNFARKASLLTPKRPLGEHLAVSLAGSETRFFRAISQKAITRKCKEISTHPSLGTWQGPTNFLHGNYKKSWFGEDAPKADSIR